MIRWKFAVFRTFGRIFDSIERHPNVALCMVPQRNLSGSKRIYEDEKNNGIHENSDLHYISIPRYKPKEPNESLVRMRARLIWQSRKRGIAENCLLLSTFADKYLKEFDSEQLHMFDNILNQTSDDWQLYYWMMGSKPVAKEFDNEIMDMLKIHCKNEEKAERFEQPVLNYEPVEKFDV